jgi:hypothetical protein
MHYKPIENCQMENAILGKDFDLGTTNSFFHVFIPWECGMIFGLKFSFMEILDARLKFVFKGQNLM